MTDLGVIFDMDGVLVDSFELHFRCWRQLAHNHGKELTAQQFLRVFGKTCTEIMRSCWPDWADHHQLAERGLEKERIYCQMLRESFPEMPGAATLVRRLHRSGFKLAVGSSAPRENVQTSVECMGTSTLFSVLVGGEQVAQGKPAPDIFELAAKQLDIPASRCVVVEDAPVGVEAARQAGMSVIALTSSSPRSKLSKADVIVDSLGEISASLVRHVLRRGLGSQMIPAMGAGEALPKTAI